MLVSTCSSNLGPELRSIDRLVLVGEECGGKPIPRDIEVVVVDEGVLRRRRLLDLLVALSAGVEEVYVDCGVLEYKPVAEALVVYRWLLGSEYNVFLVGAGCDEGLAKRLGFRVRKALA